MLEPPRTHAGELEQAPVVRAVLALLQVPRERLVVHLAQLGQVALVARGALLLLAAALAARVRAPTRGMCRWKTEATILETPTMNSLRNPCLPGRQ